MELEDENGGRRRSQMISRSNMTNAEIMVTTMATMATMTVIP